MNVRIKVGSKVKNEEIGGWFIQPIQNSSEIFPKNGDEQFQENIMVYKKQLFLQLYCTFFIKSFTEYMKSELQW